MAENSTGMNALKLAGEIILPGASQTLDGQLKSGLTHLAGGMAGRAMLGPVLGPLSWLYAGANSYSTSVTGKPVHEHFFGGKSDGGDDAAAEPSSLEN